VTAKMAQHAFAIIELDQKQDEWRRRRMLFSRYAYDRVTLNSAKERRRACHRSASKMWTVTAAAVPPPLWVSPNRACGT
jgi:hypothetical protein